MPHYSFCGTAAPTRWPGCGTAGQRMTAEPLSALRVSRSGFGRACPRQKRVSCHRRARSRFSPVPGGLATGGESKSVPGSSSARASALADLLDAASTWQAVPERSADYRSRPEGAAARARPLQGAKEAPRIVRGDDRFAARSVARRHASFVAVRSEAAAFGEDRFSARRFLVEVRIGRAEVAPERRRSCRGQV